MPQIINTNIASLNAQRNLNASQGDANVALERLSSGLRINSAKDDAAGLAISERFQSQISGLNMAQRNANDGISLAQTAEGAMDEITNNLQRIRELAVQSANATNSNSDRQALNQEVQQRIEEINRIASQTSFNGLKVLDGTFATQTFQVGANTGETISVSGLDSRGSQIGAIVDRTVGLNETVVADSTAGITETNASGFNFSDPPLAIAGSVSINGVEIPVDDDYASLDALATELDGILQDPTANGISADDAELLSGISVGSEGGRLVFSSERETAADAVIELSSEEIAAETASNTTSDSLDQSDTGAGSNVYNAGDVSGLNYETGNAVGSITLGSPSETVEFDFSGVTDEESFLEAINTQLSDAGYPDLTADVDGSNLELTLASGTLDIASTSFSDGGIPARNFNQDFEIIGEQGTTLDDTLPTATPLISKLKSTARPTASMACLH